MCLRIEGHANTATRLPRGYRVALYLGLQDLARAQPAFLIQNLHQPFGLISPSTSVQAFGSWKRESSCCTPDHPLVCPDIRPPSEPSWRKLPELGQAMLRLLLHRRGFE